MKFIGIQCVDYINKNGYYILGYKFYIFILVKFDDVFGEIIEVVFVLDQVFVMCDYFVVGDEIFIVYNKYGKVVGVFVIG